MGQDKHVTGRQTLMLIDLMMKLCKSVGKDGVRRLVEGWDLILEIAMSEKSLDELRKCVFPFVFHGSVSLQRIRYHELLGSQSFFTVNDVKLENRFKEFLAEGTDMASLNVAMSKDALADVCVCYVIKVMEEMSIGKILQVLERHRLHPVRLCYALSYFKKDNVVIPRSNFLVYAGSDDSWNKYFLLRTSGINRFVELVESDELMNDIVKAGTYIIVERA